MPQTSPFLHDLMTADPVTVAPDADLDVAIELFDRYPFRHLPVVEAEAVIGMLSDRDLQLATGWIPGSQRSHDTAGRDLPAPRSVREVMVAPVRCATPASSAAAAAELMLEHRIGALPVVDEGLLVGILTETDLLRTFVQACRDGSAPASWLTPVAEHMQTKLATLTPETSILDALERCLDEHVRHLPVVDGDELVGMISDRDIRQNIARASISDARAQSEGRLAIPDVRTDAAMSRTLVPIGPEDLLHEAAELMARNKFGALPVLGDGRLVGLLTQTDVLRHYARQL